MIKFSTILFVFCSMMAVSCAGKGKGKCNDCPKFSDATLQSQNNG